MLKVYGSLKSRAVRVLALLEELGVKYKHVQIDHTTDEYSQIHPLNLMPALQDGEQTIFESVAICMYLTDKFADKGLAPAIGTPDRGIYYQWCVYIAATFEPAIMGIFASKAQDEEAQIKAKAKLDKVVGVIKNALEGKEYLIGNQFSTADLLVASSLGWVSMMGTLELDGTLSEYVGRFTSRPSLQKLMQG